VAAEAVLAALNEPVRQALLAAVVGADELTAAAGQLGAGANVARLVGGALGGLLLDAYGLGGVVLGDAATFLLAAAVLAAPGFGAAGSPAAGGPAEPAGRAWLAGLAVVRDRRELRGTLAVTALMALAQGAFVVLFVVFVLRSLHGGGTEVGLLRGVQAVGGILGGLAVGWLARRLGPAALVGTGLAAFALVDAVIWNGPAATTALPLYLLLFAVAGAPGIVIVSGVTAVMLTATPEPYRGRVASTHAGVFGVLQAAGMLLAGLLVEPVGLLPLLNAQAVVLAAGAAVAAVLLRSAPQPAAAAAGRPVAPDRPAEDDARPVRPAVVGDERVVPLQPPTGPRRSDRPLDDQVRRPGREAADHHVPGPDPVASPDQEYVPVPQGRHHRRADHEHSLHRPAE